MSRSLAERPKGLTLTNKRGVGYAAAQIDRRKGGFEISQKSVQLNGGDTNAIGDYIYINNHLEHDYLQWLKDDIDLGEAQ